MLAQAIPSPASLYTPIAVGALMLFVIYRRVRRSFGRQPIHTKRMIVRVAIFAVVLALSMLSGLQDVRLAEGVLAGGVAGAALALLVGLKFTRFEIGGEGQDVYIPNPWVGAALTALLLGRLAWRFLVLAPVFGGGAAAAHAPAPGNSPLTMTVVGLTLGYYMVYYAGILLHHRRFKRQAQPA